MRLLWLNAVDFMSLGHLSLKLENRGLVAIEGRNTDSPAYDSNGAGKSAIFEAIVWAIYGQTMRDVGVNDVVRTGGSQCSVQLGFELRGDGYTIRRCRAGSKTTLEFLKNVGMSDPLAVHVLTCLDTADTQRQIETTIGMSFETFCSAVIYGKSEVKRFTAAGDADRKRILESLLGVEIYERCHEEAKARVTCRRADLAAAQALLAGLEAQIASGKQYITSNRHYHSQWEVNQLAHLNGMDQALAEYETVKVLASSAQARLGALREGQRAATEALMGLQAQSSEELRSLDQARFASQEELAVALADIVENRSNIALTFGANFDPQVERATIASAHIEEMDKRVLAMEDRRGKLCPTCRSSISNESVDAEILRLKTEREFAVDAKHWADVALEQLREENKKAREKLDWAETKAKDTAKQQRRALDDRSFGLRQAMALAGGQRELESMRLRKDIELAESDYAKADARLRALDIMKAERAAAASAVNPYEHSLRNAKEILAQRVKERIDLSATICAHEDALEDLDFWVMAFGRAGIRSYILDTIIPALNQRVMEISRILTNGDMQIQFATTAQTKGGREVEKFTIVTTNSNGSPVYGGNSEGEQRRIDLCVLFALHDMARNRMGGINAVFLDEIFDVLDDTGAERVIEMLNQYIDSGGLESVFVISHKAALVDLFDKRLVVTKANRVSSVHEV